MISYVGEHGQSYTIDENTPIGKGGEGKVYMINECPNSVAKIFNVNRRSKARFLKLKTMISKDIDRNILKNVSWPTDILYENGVFVGYVMPFVKQYRELNAVYGDNVVSYDKRIVIAKNLCAAVDSVHKIGQVCGDLNPKNIGVNVKTGKVTLLDVDSYHITDDSGHVFRCEVGLPDYMSPELQKKLEKSKTIAKIPLPSFGVETDRFALAVHIFSLLMNGCHPFACAIDQNVIKQRKRSITAPQPIDNIRNGVFPFEKAKGTIVIPKYAPEFKSLPNYMRELFVRAFVDGYQDPAARPDCEEWYNALNQMQNELVECNVDLKHKYYKGLTYCPWCQINSRFPKVTSNKTNNKKANGNKTSDNKLNNNLNINLNNSYSSNSPDSTEIGIGAMGVLGIISIIGLIFGI